MVHKRADGQLSYAFADISYGNTLSETEDSHRVNCNSFLFNNLQMASTSDHGAQHISASFRIMAHTMQILGKEHQQVDIFEFHIGIINFYI